MLIDVPPRTLRPIRKNPAAQTATGLKFYCTRKSAETLEFLDVNETELSSLD